MVASGNSHLGVMTKKLHADSVKTGTLADVIGYLRGTPSLAGSGSPGTARGNTKEKAMTLPCQAECHEIRKKIVFIFAPQH